MLELLPQTITTLLEHEMRSAVPVQVLTSVCMQLLLAKETICLPVSKYKTCKHFSIACAQSSLIKTGMLLTQDSIFHCCVLLQHMQRCSPPAFLHQYFLPTGYVSSMMAECNVHSNNMRNFSWLRVFLLKQPAEPPHQCTADT